jgi:capsular polysaccharide biosynthesis protein
MAEDRKILHPPGSSIRELPVNFVSQDMKLFQHELKREIPAAELRSFENVEVSREGLLFCGKKILPESFAIPELHAPMRFYSHWKLWIRARSLGHARDFVPFAFWITDDWSMAYFHWITDALPRLYAVRSQVADATLLLPRPYEEMEYVRSSLAPFGISCVRYIKEMTLCKTLMLPTRTAPTGNYNEVLIRGLRDFYQMAYQKGPSEKFSSRIYISRGKAGRRKIANESEAITVLEELGFTVCYMENLTFDQQIKIAVNADHIVSNHGAGLTNILFMRPSKCVLELRKRGDAHNNCYFALASSLGLRYFYQLCDAKDTVGDPHVADLIVDCDLLRKNLSRMLMRL